MARPASLDRQAAGELEVRPAALRAGVWLGWFSIAAMLAGLALGVPVRHRWLLLTLIASAAVANGLMLAVPGRWWLARRRGESILAIWSAGLLSLTAAVVLLAGARADLDLLLFLIVPFLATVHSGTRRLLWLSVALVMFIGVTAAAPEPLTSGQIALRAVLLAAAALLAVQLADLTRRAATARAELRERAELERLLLAEAHHRVKNSLQTVADLLLLGRPRGVSGQPFDETADRIRAIALVHRLLADRRGADVSAGALLELVAHGLAPLARVSAVDEPLEATCAQHLGIVANELVANAVRHGRPPIDVELCRENGLLLSVRDRGDGPNGSAPGLGLQLVQRVVDQGLRGSFVLHHRPQGDTEALVAFDPAGGCGS
ncbi:MAG: sensor histidine kinase [Solirubrobacteraceae bacterium]